MRIEVALDCRRCAQCGEITPHSRRRWAPLLALAGLLSALGAALAVLGGGAGPLIAALFAAAILFALDRAACWRIVCERCRWNERRRRRTSWPDPKNTEICC